MTFLDLIPGLKREATTNGGEWAGACPFCGGNDRFRAWPSEGPTGRYWCRGCGKHGDGLQLLQDRDGLTFREALKAWGLSSTGTTGHRCERTTWEPKRATTPGTTWTDRAGAFLLTCQKTLAGSAGSKCRAFLFGRGLKSETIERAGLGWNTSDQYQSREAWGLPPETKEDGKPRRVWIPSGLVIPCLAGGQVLRLRVRRPNPGNGPRYVIVSGSGQGPLILGHAGAWVIIESELDGWLVFQEAGDLAGVIALGSASVRPDQETDRALNEAILILVALDSDQAGAKEAGCFWKQTYPNARRWPVPIGKDPTEAAQQGLDLRTWVMAGLSIEPETKEPTTEPEQNTATAHQGPLQATKSTNEGKGDKGTKRMTVIRPFPDDWKNRLDEGAFEPEL